MPCLLGESRVVLQSTLRVVLHRVVLQCTLPQLRTQRCPVIMAMQKSPQQLLRVVLQSTLRQHHRDPLPLQRVVRQMSA